MDHSCSFAVRRPTCWEVRHVHLRREFTGSVLTAAYWHDGSDVHVSVPMMADTAIYIGTSAPTMLPALGSALGWDIIRKVSAGMSCIHYKKSLSPMWRPGKVSCDQLQSLTASACSDQSLG